MAGRAAQPLRSPSLTPSPASPQGSPSRPRAPSVQALGTLPVPESNGTAAAGVRRHRAGTHRRRRLRPRPSPGAKPGRSHDLAHPIALAATGTGGTQFGDAVCRSAAGFCALWRTHSRTSRLSSTCLALPTMVKRVSSRPRLAFTTRPWTQRPALLERPALCPPHSKGPPPSRTLWRERAGGPLLSAVRQRLARAAFTCFRCRSTAGSVPSATLRSCGLSPPRHRCASGSRSPHAPAPAGRDRSCRSDVQFGPVSKLAIERNLLLGEGIEAPTSSPRRVYSNEVRAPAMFLGERPSALFSDRPQPLHLS